MDKKIDAQAFETYLQKVLKLSAEDVASLYNEAGELTDFSLIERKDAERISKLSGEKQGQYNRGIKEGAEKLEKAVKEKFEVESDLIGVELFDFILTNKVSEVQKAKPEEVLKHPEVIKALNEKDKALKAKDKEWEAKMTAKELEINKQALFNKVKANGLAEFRNLNPILPTDAKKAQALENVLISELGRFNYQESGDTFIVLKEDGVELKDDFGHNIDFKSHIKGTAERYFDFKKADDRSSSGNNNQGTSGARSGKVRQPKDKQDFVNIMKDQTLTPQERIEIGKLWSNVKNK